MIGAMVSVSGMIGFVGLMVPHVMRLIVGSDHRLLLPASFLAGGIFLCWADTLARVLLAPAELPVGIITAFFGGPFFLFLALSRRQRSAGFMNPAIQARDLSFAYQDRVSASRHIARRLIAVKWSASSVPTARGKQPCSRYFRRCCMGKAQVKINDRDIETYGRRDLSRLFAVVAARKPREFSLHRCRSRLNGASELSQPFALEGKKDLEDRPREHGTDRLLCRFANRYLHELSGGEKQRVIIARALAQEPEILLLDEPSAFLDLKHQVQVFELLRRLNRERGLTIVAALHDLNLASLFFPRLVMLRDGKIYRDGSPQEVLTEATIEEVYGIRVRVEHDPVSEKPQLFICPSL